MRSDFTTKNAENAKRTCPQIAQMDADRREEKEMLRE
jgi:hypothetical protein